MLTFSGCAYRTYANKISEIIINALNKAENEDISKELLDQTYFKRFIEVGGLFDFFNQSVRGTANDHNDI